MAIVENQEDILKLANDFGADIANLLLTKINVLNSDDPADYIYLSGHTLACVVANTIKKMEDYDEIYGINFDREVRLKWLHEIVKVYLRYMTEH
jgi:hypothetical protein